MPNKTVAIIGRPNVGKSTLFNRLAGKRLALVDDTPGVTRDRRLGELALQGISAHIVDTAGLEEGAVETLAGRMRAQTEMAIAAADLCIFVVDARAGITLSDKEFAGLLRRSAKPVLVAANKSEGRAALAGVYDAFELGFGDPIAISAEHGEGMGELHDAIAAIIGHDPVDEDGEADPEPGGDKDGSGATPAYDADRPLRITILGRPNVGKSTLINRLLGEERLLTGPEAGITRDAIAVEWKWQGRPVALSDTAGLRRKARIHEKLEKLSVASTLLSVRYAEVAVVVIDAEQGFEKQDLQILNLVIKEGRAPVVAINKWDLVAGRTARLSFLRGEAERLLPQIKGLGLVPVSGKTGFGLERLMKAVAAADRAWNQRVPTGPLNRWLAQVLAHHPPPAVAGKRIRLKYITQAKSRPPTFALSCSRPDALPESYRRYLINGLFKDFDLMGTPIRINLRKGENPYASKPGRRH